MSWASGGALNATIDYAGGGGGNSGGAIGFTSDTDRDHTESYNGTSWTTEGNLTSTSRTNGTSGGGTDTDGIVHGGNFVTQCNEFNGSTWSNGGTASSGTTGAACDTGSSTDAIRISGSTSYWNDVETTEEYNGTSWSSGGNVSVGSEFPAGGGNSSDAIVFGGEIGTTKQTRCEEYNGTSWSSGGSITTATSQAGGGGNSTDAIMMGGFLGISAETETYNGTSWTAESEDLSTARRWYGGLAGGSSTDAIAGGGNGSSGTLTSTEEWSASVGFASNAMFFGGGM